MRSTAKDRDDAAVGGGVAVPPESLLGYRLWQASHLWQRQVGRQLKPLGLTPVQYVLLAAANRLVSLGEAPSQIRIADYTGIEKMMVSKNLRALAAAGYVSRTACEEDRRVVEVRLTRAGKDVLQRAFAAARVAHDSFFCFLGQDRKRMNALLRLLIHGYRDQRRAAD